MRPRTPEDEAYLIQEFNPWVIRILPGQVYVEYMTGGMDIGVLEEWAKGLNCTSVSDSQEAFALFMLLQVLQALGDVNWYYAGLYFSREPSIVEAVWYYIRHANLARNREVWQAEGRLPA